MENDFKSYESIKTFKMYSVLRKRVNMQSLEILNEITILTDTILLNRKIDHCKCSKFGFTFVCLSD